MTESIPKSHANRINIGSVDPTPAATPPQIASLTRPEGSHGGTWGEHHGPDSSVSVSRGLHNFEKLARETSRLADSPTESSRGRDPWPNVSSSVLNFARSISKGPQPEFPEDEVIETSRNSLESRDRPGEEGTFGEAEHEQPERPEEAVNNAEAQGFDLRQWIENRVAAEESRGIPRKRVGLSWRDLRVAAPGGSSAVFIKTLPQAILGTFGIDLAYFAKGIFQGGGEE